MILFTGHTDPVNQLAFAPDGRVLASAGDDGAVCVWDVATRERLARINWGAKWVFTAAFAPDGLTLAAGTEASLLLLQADQGVWKPRVQSREHAGWVTAVAFSPDGQLLASGGVDGTIRLWDGARPQRQSLRSIGTGLGSLRAVAFTPDGRAVAAGGVGGVGLWSPVGSDPIFHRRLRDADVYSLAFTADGSALLAAANRSVVVFDLETGKARELLRSGGRFTRCLATGPGGLMVTGRDDGVVQVWDEPGGQDRGYRWHDGGVNAVAVSPDGCTAASAGDDFTVCLWDI